MKNLFFILLLLVSFLEAKMQYVENTLLTYSKPDDKKLSGKVLPTTPVEVLKVEGDKALIKLTGWNQGKTKRILYFSKGHRIITAAFNKKAEYERKILKKEMVDEKEWSNVEITTWVENKHFINDVKPLFKQAKNLMETNCGLCHNAHPTHEFTANQWPSIIKGMKTRTPMDKKQVLLVTQFAQKHAKDIKKH